MSMHFSATSDSCCYKVQTTPPSSVSCAAARTASQHDVNEISDIRCLRRLSFADYVCSVGYELRNLVATNIPENNSANLFRAAIP